MWSFVPSVLCQVGIAVFLSLSHSCLFINVVSQMRIFRSKITPMGNSAGERKSLSAEDVAHTSAVLGAPH